MKKTLTMFALTALLPAGVVLADSGECHVTLDQSQPREAAMKVAEANGWTVLEFEVDDGCYEIEARDQTDRLIEVKLDPATLQVVEMEYEDAYEEEDEDSAGNPAPTGTMAPPDNGLFGNGAPPQVQVN